MSHVVSKPTAPFSGAAEGGAIEVHQVPFDVDNFTWLLVCKTTGETAAVDGGEAAPVLDYVARESLNLTTILTTHTHGDHIGLHRELAELGKLDALRVVGNEALSSVIPGLERGEGVGEGSRVKLGAVEGDVLLTEGHIDGHLTYVFGDVMFPGDTLFAGGCGYLFDGPPAKMHASLSRLAGLDGGVRVCCAHEYTEDNLRFAWSLEPDNQALAERIQSVWALRARGESSVPSTVAEERATNPFLRCDSQTLRAAVGEAMPDAPMDTAADVFAATRALKNGGAYKKLGDTGLPL